MLFCIYLKRDHTNLIIIMIDFIIKDNYSLKPYNPLWIYHSYHSYGKTNMKPFEGFLDDLYESNGQQNDDYLDNLSQRFIFLSQNN